MLTDKIIKWHQSEAKKKKKTSLRIPAGFKCSADVVKVGNEILKLVKLGKIWLKPAEMSEALLFLAAESSKAPLPFINNHNHHKNGGNKLSAVCFAALLTRFIRRWSPGFCR